MKSRVAGSEVHRLSGSMILYLFNGERRRVAGEFGALQSETAHTGRGEHLDKDVPVVTPVVQQAEQAAEAADAHMSVGRV